MPIPAPCLGTKGCLEGQGDKGGPREGPPKRSAVSPHVHTWPLHTGARSRVHHHAYTHLQHRYTLVYLQVHTKIQTDRIERKGGVFHLLLRYPVGAVGLIAGGGPTRTHTLITELPTQSPPFASQPGSLDLLLTPAQLPQSEGDETGRDEAHPGPAQPHSPFSFSFRESERESDRGVDAAGTSGHPSVLNPPGTARGHGGSGQCQWPWPYGGARGGKRGGESSLQSLTAPEGGGKA